MKQILFSFMQTQKIKRIQKMLCLFLASFMLANVSYAQVEITKGGMPYTQDFNTLLSTGTNNAFTMPNWYASTTTYSTENVTNNAMLRSYGNNAANRTLGANSTSTTVRFGVRMRNTTGKQITSFRIYYRGEQWNKNTGTSAFAKTLQFHYWVGTNLTNINPASPSPIAFTTFDFVAPNQLATTPTGPTDGKSSVNYTNKSGTLTVNVNNGQEIMLRWSKSTASGYGLGVDDLLIVPITPDPIVFCTQPHSIYGTTIIANSLAFEDTEVGNNSPQIISIERYNLTGNVTLSMQNGISSAFSVSQTTLASGVSNVTVTFTPTAGATFNDMLIISGGGLEEDVKIPLTGIGVGGVACTTLPEITDAIDIEHTETEVELYAEMKDEGGCVTEYGFVYSTEANPTVVNTKAISDNFGGSEFTQTISNLTCNETYYFRAYAIYDGNTVVYNEKDIEVTMRPCIVHTILAEVKGIGGTISPSGEVTVNEGVDTTFTFIPNTCYEVDSVWVDFELVTVSGNTYTFTNVNADHFIEVSFKKKYVTGIDVQNICGASFTWINGTTYYANNNTATDTIAAANGCDSIVTLNLTLLTKYTVTFMVKGEEIGEQIQSTCNATVPLPEASACMGWEFAGWSIGEEITTVTATKPAHFVPANMGTFTPEGNVTLYAVYKKDDSAYELVTALSEGQFLIATSEYDGQYYFFSGINAAGHGNGIPAASATSYLGVPAGAMEMTVSAVPYRITNESNYLYLAGSAPGNLRFSETQQGAWSYTGTALFYASTVAMQSYNNSAGYFRSNNDLSGNPIILFKKNSGAAVYYSTPDCSGSGESFNITATVKGTGGTISPSEATVEEGNPKTFTFTPDACYETDSVWVDNVSVSVSGNSYTFTNVQDNHTIEVSFKKKFATGTDVQNICGTEFTWIDGITYTSNNNTATYTIANGAANGCDSMVTLNLTFRAIATGTDLQHICGMEFTWIDGVTYTSNNNTATYTIANGAANGCDSMVTLNLTFRVIATGTDVQHICGTEFTWIDGVTYTSNNNTATYTIANGAVNGCDSMVTLNLTFRTIAIGTDLQHICGTEFTWIDGVTYTSNNNTATYTIANGAVNGCDSVVTLNLTFRAIATGTDVQNICGTEFTWIDGVTYTSNNNTATYTIENGAVNGCDSMVTLNLTFRAIATGTDVQNICGTEFTWIDGITYTSDNNTATYTYPGGAANGCDSIVTLNLTLESIATGIDVQNICGSGFKWIDGNTYTENTDDAVYTIEGGAANGCDSIVTLHLTLYPTFLTQISDTIVYGKAYDFFGHLLTTSGVYHHTLNSIHNCDSIIELTLSVKFIIHATAGAEGTITPSGTIEVSTGDSQTFIFEPNSGYSVYQLIVDGTDMADSIAGGRYTFTNVDTNHFIAVSFIKIGKTCPSEVIDVEGNIYRVTEFSEMCWTENLRTRSYHDSSSIPFAHAYYSMIYADSIANAKTFGLLYSWNSAMGIPSRSRFVQGICPTGWHIPSQSEFDLLKPYTAEELMTVLHWIPPMQGTDEHNFSVLPAGSYDGAANRFINLYGATGFWSSDSDPTSDQHAYYLGLNYYCGDLQKLIAPKNDGLSVRCIMD